MPYDKSGDWPLTRSRILSSAGGQCYDLLRYSRQHLLPELLLSHSLAGFLLTDFSPKHERRRLTNLSEGNKNSSAPRQPQSQPFLLFQIVIVGNGAVGKSSMIQRYCKGLFSVDYKMTIGVDFLERVIRYALLSLSLVPQPIPFS